MRKKTWGSSHQYLGNISLEHIGRSKFESCSHVHNPNSYPTISSLVQARIKQYSILQSKCLRYPQSQNPCLLELFLTNESPYWCDFKFPFLGMSTTSHEMVCPLVLMSLLMWEKIPRNKGDHFPFHKSQLDSPMFGVVAPIGLCPYYHSRGFFWWDLRSRIR